MKVRNLIRLIEGDGWYLVRTRGSHPAVAASNQIRHCYCCWKIRIGGATRYAQQRSQAGRPQRLAWRNLCNAYLFLKKIQAAAVAYVLYLFGCVAIGETMDEVRGLITEAIQCHVEGLREDGVVVPLPSSTAAFIEAATA